MFIVPEAIPLKCPKIEMWLDASDPSVITAAAALVSDWLDKTAKRRNLTNASGASQPVYTQSAINGRPAVQFNLNKTLSNVSLPALQTTGFTIFFVVKRANTVSGGGFNVFAQTNVLMRFDPVGEGNRFSAFVVVGGAIEPRVQVPLVPVDGTPYILSVKYDGTFLKPKVHNTGGGNTGVRTPATAGGNGFEISSNNVADNFVGEEIIFTTALSDAIINKIASYLSNKWGIPVV